MVQIIPIIRSLVHALSKGKRASPCPIMLPIKVDGAVVVPSEILGGVFSLNRALVEYRPRGNIRATNKGRTLALSDRRCFSSHRFRAISGNNDAQHSNNGIVLDLLDFMAKPLYVELSRKDRQEMEELLYNWLRKG